MRDEIVEVTKTPTRHAYNHLILMNLHNSKVVRIIGCLLSGVRVRDMLLFSLLKYLATHPDRQGLALSFFKNNPSDGLFTISGGRRRLDSR